VSPVVDWLVRLPTGLGFLVLLAAGLVIALGCTWLAERAFHDDARTRTGTSITTVVGVVAGLYAVLVAFVIVNEWQAYVGAQTEVSNESAALTTMYENSSVLSQPSRTNIEAALSRYNHSVICDEIPYLATHQERSVATREALHGLFVTVARAESREHGSTFYRLAAEQLDDVAAARRGRINSAASPLPDLLLIVIVVTSIGLIAAVSALDTQHRRWHVFITIALTVIVALNLTLVLNLDRPFDGAAKVSVAPLREAVPSGGPCAP
jgi:hypothetical protein